MYKILPTSTRLTLWQERCGWHRWYCCCGCCRCQKPTSSSPASHITTRTRQRTRCLVMPTSTTILKVWTRSTSIRCFVSKQLSKSSKFSFTTCNVFVFCCCCWWCCCCCFVLFCFCLCIHTNGERFSKILKKKKKEVLFPCLQETIEISQSSD